MTILSFRVLVFKNLSHVLYAALRVLVIFLIITIFQLLYQLLRALTINLFVDHVALNLIITVILSFFRLNFLRDNMLITIRIRLLDVRTIL